MSRGESRAARRERLAETAKTLPADPGAYLFRDSSGRVIYVGKAKSLRARVRSYFGRPHDPSPKVHRTVEQTHDIECIVTRTEMEALLLEYNLIKEFRPRYNVSYRDDKSYPYLKITLADPFPRAYPTRNVEEDGSRYFGPYTDAGAMRRTLRMLRTFFPLPTCNLKLVPGMSERGCLDYFLGRCVGPCRGDVEPADYRRLVDEVTEFLSGRKERVVAELEKEMTKASREMRFEDAAKLRDRLFSVRSTVAKQHVTLRAKGDLDAIGLSRYGSSAIGVLLPVRGGRVIGRERMELRCTPSEPESELLRGLLLGFYASRETPPGRIVVRRAPAERGLLEEWLGERAKRKVRLSVPKRGDAVRLLEMAEHNAQVALARENGETSRVDGRRAVAELGEALGLAEAPRRIEGFDISTTQGTDTYASLVAFVDGAPDKSGYRTFRIRVAPRRDDPRAIEEAVRRRARRIEASGGAPDLLLIDGGPTQLAAACRALVAGGLGDLPAVGLAKREEEIWFPERAEPLRLPRASAALRLLQRVRDEAHRFALKSHRRRRGTRLSASALDDVPGVGPAKRRALLTKFGSVAGIRRAGREAVADVPGIGRELALAIWTHLGGAEES